MRCGGERREVRGLGRGEVEGRGGLLILLIKYVLLEEKRLLLLYFRVYEAVLVGKHCVLEEYGPCI